MFHLLATVSSENVFGVRIKSAVRKVIFYRVGKVFLNNKIENMFILCYIYSVIKNYKYTIFIFFLLPMHDIENITLGKILEMKILTDLHVLRFSE